MKNLTLKSTVLGELLFDEYNKAYYTLYSDGTCTFNLFLFIIEEPESNLLKNILPNIETLIRDKYYNIIIEDISSEIDNCKIILNNDEQAIFKNNKN